MEIWPNFFNVGLQRAGTTSLDDLLKRTEGMSLVIPEAMESEIPEIASRVVGIIDTIQHEISELIRILISSSYLIGQVFTLDERLFSIKH